ncbi:MAG: tyrosine-type recombinase/integrase [Candidatus Aminicenantaceae bacterium]
MVESGVDIITVEDLLGHSSVKITDRYTHSFQDQKKKAVEVLCKKPEKTGEKSVNLLHNCDMKRSPEKSEQLTHLFSVN